MFDGVGRLKFDFHTGDYRDDCENMLGRLLTHDDQKSDKELSGAFEATQVEAIYGSSDAPADGGLAEPEPWATDAPAADVAEDPWAAPASATESEDYWWSSDSSSDTGSSSWGWGSSDSSDSSCSSLSLIHISEPTRPY